MKDLFPSIAISLAALACYLIVKDVALIRIVGGRFFPPGPYSGYGTGAGGAGGCGDGGGGGCGGGGGGDGGGGC